jgi:hypothetical protein
MRTFLETTGLENGCHLDVTEALQWVATTLSHKGVCLLRTSRHDYRQAPLAAKAEMLGQREAYIARLGHGGFGLANDLIFCRDAPLAIRLSVYICENARSRLHMA